jgi:hypothetical protein
LNEAHKIANWKVSTWLPCVAQTTFSSSTDQTQKRPEEGHHGNNSADRPGITDAKAKGWCGLI